MDAVGNILCDLVSIVRLWIPWRGEPANVSRDFWMPDQSCRVCYECDSQFTLFNRRHHCRLCGRIFCGKCTANTVPTPCSSQNNSWDENERIRVCNYCYKQWEQGIVAFDNEIQVSNLEPISSLSTSSLVSSKTSCTANSSNITLSSMPYSVGSHQQIQQGANLSQQQSPVRVNGVDREPVSSLRERNDLVADQGEQLSKQYGFSMNGCNDEDEYSVYQSDSETRREVNGCYAQVDFDGISESDGLQKVHPGREVNAKVSPKKHGFNTHSLEGTHSNEKNEDEPDICDENEAISSVYVSDDVDSEPVDFENNGVLWLPPEPEDGEDEREAILFDDDDDYDGNVTGEWGYLRTSNSFGSGEYRYRDRSGEEHKKVMKNAVDGHFRALVTQLLEVENLPVIENDKNSWLEIITSLSWEAASLLKPDMSKGGGMDPAGYAKIKCIACGSRIKSEVVKGVVCKKNVAHRRMKSKMDKPRLLIIGGALEYQRVTNLLSSVDTLLQQETDHLKMAVAKIAAHNPTVLLVEKSVSRYAQEYLLAKDISLVLNVKRPLLERIARCTGTQIVPSIDHLSSQKLGYCETFHVEKFVEDLSGGGQSGKKTVKTLMFFEGCPKPLGCTILLRGADEDELKKVKHVVQYGIFAAYHLALETSFLADEGASPLPEFPLNSLVLPNKSLSIERSISIVPGFSVSGNINSRGPEHETEPRRSKSVPISDLVSLVRSIEPISSQSMQHESNCARSTIFSSVAASENAIPNSYHKNLLPCASERTSEVDPKQLLVPEISELKNTLVVMNNHPSANGYENQGILANTPQNGDSKISTNQISGSEFLSKEGVQNQTENPGIVNEEKNPLKEEFPPSPSDQQSILVSLSSRCVWKGTVCERSHLFRIKYYGSFDKPLGRFLRDNLFDEGYQCHSCEMPSESHVHCYTHRQGTLTISVKKLPEIILPGAGDGKIWMWHRCLRCPRANGFPPATRRIVMSDAAWGLSFGKFLELSFSNHAAASRVASCGHSLHRDCLRFYGFGMMVACFRYASIDVHSVYLPPHKLEFDYGNQDWIQKELDEVANRAEILFSEVLNALSQIGVKRSSSVPVTSSLKAPELKMQFAELDGVLQTEKVEFEEAFQKILNQEKRKGQPWIDILEINRLRRQLLFQSYMWDHRLIYAASLYNSSKKSSPTGSISEENEKSSDENHLRVNPMLEDSKLDEIPNTGRGVDGNISKPDASHQEVDKAKDINLEKDDQPKNSISKSLSDTLDEKWTGENQSGVGIQKDNASVNRDTSMGDSLTITTQKEAHNPRDHAEDQNGPKSISSFYKGNDNMEDSLSWFYRQFSKNFFAGTQKFDTLVDYNPVYVSSFRELELQGGARLLLPVGVNDTAIPVYDDEPSSIIAYSLMSPQYHAQLADEGERPKDGNELAPSYFSDSSNFQSFHSDEITIDFQRSFGSGEDMMTVSGSHNSSMLDPLLYTKAMHARVSFAEDSPNGKVKYSVISYYAKRFEALRRICCPSELDYIRSLSRCKKWGAQGGKSNVFFAKTLDDRFIIKQVTKTELESFIKFGPDYFKYLSESIGSRSPTCLAKILGIYQVTTKHIKGGKESKMDVLVMENLLFRRNVTRLYDLKGSSRSRYNPDSSGSNKVLLDQNLIEAMPTSPIFVGNKAKRLLERGVWNDTGFLASIDVMDYSLLAGVDEEKHELVIGIIDFMRQYTWDKHLETWAKASGILGGSKNASPTVISPKQYKKRFRKAMSTYFLMLPDQWSPPSLITSHSQSDLCAEENNNINNNNNSSNIQSKTSVNE
ncbi:hypothetical protein Lal_00036326 [Lupinus albus]|uniref:1-phosphatidylinositol-3-phosphate 5-kinase n=1 Tax=Lupinus albus TaxID=3870 RepID=A0A6A4NWR8_LUPAL|nr:putative 1-phosphatidylinositol-3-phosphate 5-kinase chromatin regulator PHD family [Lupinus albus]KAF1891975.1 hypothetical protein Lal_00036326 [Lupinus albus]